MTEEQLARIPRRNASEVVTAVPGGLRYEERLEAAIEAWANEEWWRGFHAGHREADVDDQTAFEMFVKSLKP